MFTKLTSRISRTLVAVVIPAALSLGLAGTSFGNVYPTQQQVVPVQCSNSLNFAGESNGVPVTFQMFYLSPKSINGYITINGNAYQFVACVVGDNINGVLMDNGREVRFDAVGQANLLYLRIGERVVTLQLLN